MPPGSVAEVNAVAARAYRRRKREKLIYAIRVNIHNLNPILALADYLEVEQDFELLEEDVLRPLDPSLIPQVTLPQGGSELWEAPEIKNIIAAMGALSSAAPLFRTLMHAPPSEAITSYAVKCLGIWIEAWPGVTKWIAYCFMHASRLKDHEWLLADCTDLLVSITTTPWGTPDPLKEELSLMPCTIDVLFILLGQIDNKTGKYSHIQVMYTERCALMEALRVQFLSDAAWDAIHGRLLSVSRKTRHVLIAALVDRPQQFVDVAEGSRIIGVAKSMDLLVHSVMQLTSHAELFKEFSRQDCFAKLALACSALAEKAHTTNLTDSGFWKALSGAITTLLLTVTVYSTNPTVCLAKMFDAGLFLCMIRCLPYSAPRAPGAECVLPPLDLLPHLRVRKVFESIWKRGDLEQFYRRQNLHEKVEDICKLYHAAIASAHAVHVGRRDVHISLCSNLQHPTSRVTDEELKTCSQCHAVTYCSKSCQEQDWVSLHHRECRHVKNQKYKHRGMKATLCSIQLKHDYLAHLEYALNSDPVNAIAIRKRRANRPLNESVPVCLFDFSNQGRGNTIPGLGQQTPILDTTDVDREWGPRIERCIKQAEEELHAGSSQIVLVESTFPLDQFSRLCTFATLREYPDAPKGYRWKVLASVFRVGKHETRLLDTGIL
ncbi:hypothetical protein DFP72DRAFT_1169767 [Ephemerocybe angulata]|uniref:MYND-type domain-containing protein n=1 Tax=Ephemerocybe angulata TaxID=980116 RepID=A0A8H6M6U4_9AGAR|nr:hypothetical protein DFP72DRAFT_1169767 [Tulosesus angulatus]